MKTFEPHHKKTCIQGFRRSGSRGIVQNKGTDQLRNYQAADLHLCFRICKNVSFLMTRLFFFKYIHFKVIQNPYQCCLFNQYCEKGLSTEKHIFLLVPYKEAAKKVRK